MPLIETKGAASAQGFGEFAKTGEAVYIESCFSTWLYTGNSSTQTITNGIDLSTKGGLVWVKRRSAAGNNILADTNRGASAWLSSNLTNGQGSDSTKINSFTSSGFVVGSDSTTGSADNTYASWTFRKQPKFFDVVTYTGTGSARTVAHSLGSVPGCMIVKRTDAARDWAVYHRSLGATKGLYLNTTAAEFTSLTALWNGTTPTSTEFSVGTNGDVNASGGTYVAYLFAHDAGGFGLTGTDNVVTCGSFTTDGSGTATVSLGYEPQWLLWKRSDSTSNWLLLDNMRSWNVGGNDFLLRPNLSDAESTGANYGFPTATGFYMENMAASATYIYIAIRRGPMKTPTTGTSVFSPVAYTGGTVASPRPIEAGFPPDFLISNSRTLGSNHNVGDKLRGRAAGVLRTNTTNAELPPNSSSDDIVSFDQNGVTYGTAWNAVFNASNDTYVSYFMRRAPGFFDVVCYTGTGVARTVNHNLGVVPELIILKSRSNGTNNWSVYSATVGNLKILRLNTSDDESSSNNDYWNSTTPTSTVFTVGSSLLVNQSSATYVSYLFASCPGVSKVGTYTGNGTSLTVNCGFTGGARFVLIKRTNSTGDWVVFDSARGIVAGNDPFLELNTTAAEQTGQDAVDADSTGFIVNQTAENLNVNGGTYIFLAIA